MQLAVWLELRGDDISEKLYACFVFWLSGCLLRQGGATPAEKRLQGPLMVYFLENICPEEFYNVEFYTCIRPQIPLTSRFPTHWAQETCIFFLVATSHFFRFCSLFFASE